MHSGALHDNSPPSRYCKLVWQRTRWFFIYTPAIMVKQGPRTESRHTTFTTSRAPHSVDVTYVKRNPDDNI